MIRANHSGAVNCACTVGQSETQDGDPELGPWGHAMTCKTAVRTFCNYLEGHLSAHVVMALRRHLDGCKECRLVLETAQRTLEINFNVPALLPHRTTRLHS